MRVLNKTVTVNSAKQVHVKGELITAKQFLLTNIKNQGLTPFDIQWRSDNTEYIIIAAGTLVDYDMQETHEGNSHTITVRREGEVYQLNLPSKS